MTRVLHVIRRATDGGASLGLLRMCVDGPQGFSHVVFSLLPPDRQPVERFRSAGVRIYWNGLGQAVSESDVVQFEWWNNPEMVKALLLEDLPPCRIVLHSRAHLRAPFMCPSQRILERVDAVTVTDPTSAKVPAFVAMCQDLGLNPVRCVYSSATRACSEGLGNSFGRMRIGYLGTVEPIKLSRDFMGIAAEVLRRVPGAELHVAGEGELDMYQRQADALGVGGRVRFHGFVNDAYAFLRGVSVFLYPLNPFTYATSEKAVQEAMYAEVPVVAYPYAGLADLLTPRSAVICHSAAQMVRGVTELLLDTSKARQIGLAGKQRVSQWTTIRSWRQSAAASWNRAASLPKRPRSAGNLGSVSLLSASYHLGVVDRPKSARDREDFDSVARFVLDEYRLIGDTL